MVMVPVIWGSLSGSRAFKGIQVCGFAFVFFFFFFLVLADFCLVYLIILS